MIRKLDFNALFVGLLYLLLLIAMGVNGGFLLFGGEKTHLTYLNYYSSGGIEAMLGYFPLLFYIAGALMLLAVVLVVVSLFKREFIAKESNARWLRWALLSSIVGFLIYGFMTRIVRNNDAGAELYFYIGLLYLALWIVESRWQPLEVGDLFNQVKGIPILLLVIYSLGWPGVTKLINGEAGMAGYVQMFKGSIFDIQPMGVVPFMYVIAILEAVSGLLALLALVTGEFKVGGRSGFSKWALLVATGTFVALMLGLAVLGYFPGATNLVFYALFTLMFYFYLQDSGVVDTKLWSA